MGAHVCRYARCSRYGSERVNGQQSALEEVSGKDEAHEGKDRLALSFRLVFPTFLQSTGTAGKAPCKVEQNDDRSSIEQGGLRHLHPRLGSLHDNLNAETKRSLRRRKRKVHEWKGNNHEVVELGHRTEKAETFGIELEGTSFLSLTYKQSSSNQQIGKVQLALGCGTIRHIQSNWVRGLCGQKVEVSIRYKRCANTVHLCS